MILFLIACTNQKLSDSSTPRTDGESGIIMATVAMDYSVGSLAYFDLDSSSLTQNIASISGDPIVVNEGGWVWQINRYQYDTLRKYDPSNLQVPLVEVSLASEVGSSNPHDVAVCGGYLYVSLYGDSRIPVLNLETLEEIYSIDISEWADQDGIPEASSMVVVGTDLYVGLQRLDRSDGFAPKTSITLKLDCENHTISESWEMGSNINLIEWDESVAMITQNTNSLDGGVLVWAGSDWERIWTSEVQLSSVDHHNGTLFYSSLSPNQNDYILHCVDIESGSDQTSDTWSEYITDLLIEDDSNGWVGAHWGWSDIANSQPGLYQVDLETCSVTNFWDMELAPFSMIKR